MKTNRYSWSFLTDFKDIGAKIMYKPIDKLQYPFLNFKQPMGRHMNSDNNCIMQKMWQVARMKVSWYDKIMVIMQKCAVLLQVASLETDI